MIVDGDGVLFAEGFGVAASGGDPVTPQTPFHLASVSKAITALAVMQLVEAGQLDLNTPLGRSNLGLGWENLPASDVTVNNLLSHTTGWTEYDGLVESCRSRFGYGSAGRERAADRRHSSQPSHR